MQFKMKENRLLSECYYEAYHESGLKIILIPKPDSPITYAVIAAKCGAIDTSFRMEGDSEFIQVPDGLAHFLEHKMFECDDGDAFLKYAKTGANGNAFTSFDKTCYMFNCNSNFYESLDILLDFVQRPYFTKETVDKEQGIIGQEIKMYEDNAGWIIYIHLLNALYSVNPVSHSITGTVESISCITSELLYKCWDAFYNPSNMTLALSGDFDFNKTVDFIDKKFFSRTPKIVEREPFYEPREVRLKRVEAKMPVSMPMIAIGYKDIICNDPFEQVKRDSAADIILEAMFGNASEFFCTHFDAGDINSTFSADYPCGRDYALIVIETETRDVDKTEELIKNHIKHTVESGICQDDFELAKRKLYGIAVASFESAEEVADAAIANDFAGTDIFASFEALLDIDLDYCNTLIKQMFVEEASAVSVIYPM